ncbi:DUF3122 domain-containing protein [Pleurocapsales cyanobacterium LEGE 10410]|nr:DUF3122 domain-containing protein [Pleurocapsales cyanobacterium LEGE 10410]
MFNRLVNLIFQVFHDPSIVRRSILLCNLIVIFTVGSLTIGSPATALLRQHHETHNVLRYHARDSLKDRNGNTWQVLLFPDNSNSATKYYLRLVGFPGINSFVHPQSLEILTSQGKILTAMDAYEESAPAPNVGQYDFTPILSQLPTKGSLKLAVPLQEHDLSLKIPGEVLTEWQLLTQEIEVRD